MSGHEHVDGIGEGYCSCGAERCSLPGCDGYCVHPGGWIERDELLRMRSRSAQAYVWEITSRQVFRPSFAALREILEQEDDR